MKRAGATPDQLEPEPEGEERSPEKPATPTDEKKPAAAPKTEAERIAAAEAAFEAGDMKALAVALGKDAKIADASNEKFSIMRRKAEKLGKLETQLKSEETRLKMLGVTLREEFGEPRVAKTAYKQGKFSAAAVALQKWFGDDFATITKNIAREVAGLSPEEKKQLEEKYKFEQDKAAFEAEKRKTQIHQTEAQKKDSALKTIATKCTGHDVMKLKNGAQLVLAEMESSWDPDQKGFRLTFKQAADAVLERKLEEARELGLPVERSTTKKTEEKPSTTETTPPAPEQDGRFKKRRSFEERQEMARRLTYKNRAK